MKIEIKDMIPDDSGKIRMYFTIDGGDMTSMLLEKNDLSSLQTVENAIKDLFKGKEYIGISFDI
ncbi:hypothetical protein KAR91_06510 [Candidatus Pacearchaeota archaeon]|nr:hypothetical protein [Candidatus Pacearchaeota archaeon]